MNHTLGIDAGSAFAKAAVVGEGILLASAVLPSGGNYAESARRVSEAAIQKAGLSRANISTTIATGWGAAAVDFAGRSVSEITSHAAGIFYLFPSARTVIDIGGQFSRAIKLDREGRVAHFVQNEKCAAGSGRFLQVIARILHIRVEDLGTLSLESTHPVDFTTGCAVFAESEAISRISEGASPADILAGVHKAMAAKVVNLITRLGLTEDCAITGGGAKDAGLVRAIETELGIRVFVPEEPQISAALGAALPAA